MTLNSTMKKALSLVIVAILLFIISGFNAIELVGKYKAETGGLGFGMDEDDVSVYMSYGLFGTMSADVKFSSKMKKDLKDQLGDNYKEFMDNMEESIKEETKGTKWHVKGDKIIMEQDGNEGENYYSISGSTLNLYENEDAKEDKEEYMELKKTFFSSLTCPAGLLRIVAVILILAAAYVFLTGKDKDGSGSTFSSGFSGRDVIASRCTACGSPIKEGARFCDVCGTPAGEAPAPVLASRCESCGSSLKDGAKFCDICGAPVGGVATPPAPAAPVYEAPAPAAPAYEEPVYTPPVEASEAPAPTPAPTPAYEPAPSAAPTTKSASDHNRFSAAGDL